MTGRRRRMLRWAVGVTAGLCIIIGGVMIFEERLIFFPDRDDGTYGAVRRSLEPGARVEGVALVTEDGVQLHGWYVSLREESQTRPVVLFLHGNAGNLTYWAPVYKDLLDLGAEVLAVDYRGFGRSEGRPDEEGVYRDAAAAWAWLTEERGIPGERIVVYGFSLGGGVATWLATEERPAGLILQSTFTSIPDVAATVFPPARWLVRTRMDSLSRIPDIPCPILVIHGTADEMIPYRLGRQLYEAAPPGTLFHEVKEGTHNETFDQGGSSLRNQLQEFIKSCTDS